MLIKPLSKHSCINKIQGVSFSPVFSKPSKYKFQIQEQNPRYSAHYSGQVKFNYLEVLEVNHLDEWFSSCISQHTFKDECICIYIVWSVYVKFSKDSR